MGWPGVEMWLPEVEMWVKGTENCEYFGKRRYKEMAGHFLGVLEKATPAKWRYLRVVYGYGFATRITLIWELIPLLALGIPLGIPSQPPGLSTTMPRV